MKKHRDLQLSAEAFSMMESYYHTEWIKLEKLYNSKHDAEFIKLAKELERSHLFIPIGKSTLDILESIFSEAFFSAGNPIEITKNEDEEIDIASCLNVLVDYYYKISKPYIALSMAFSSAARFGVGSVLPYWDKNRSMPITRYVPPTKIAFDVEALTRDEIQYTSYKFKQTKQDIAKKVDDKFYDKIKKADLNNILGSKYEDDNQKYKRVEVVEVYTLRTDGKFTVRTFIKSKLVRDIVFKKCPIKSGYLTAVLPTVDDSLEDRQSAGVGESVLGIMADIIKELNIKRNQIIDINEQLIDPYTMVGDEADIDPDDAGRIKGVVNVGDPNKVKRFPPQSSFPIEKEIAILQKDIDDITAINSMQRGQTSSSDRRPASGMALLNANSSTRLSKMATTINDTLFQEWAEAFVYFIYVNAPDALINELFGSNPLGKQGERKEMDYVVNVNFGQTINRNIKVSELTMVLNMLNGREDADVMPILKEVLKLILGDTFDITSIFTGVYGEQGDRADNRDAQGEADGGAGNGSESLRSATPRGVSTDGTITGSEDSTQSIGATQNQI